MLVAIQDEGSTHGSAANDALRRLGASDPILLEYRSSYALIGYAGSEKVHWISQAQNNRKNGPSVISVTIDLKKKISKRAGMNPHETIHMSFIKKSKHVLRC